MDKPSGWTSHDVVAKVRNLTGIRKVGHSGTLDPMATGLLVLGLGKATRLLRYVQDLPKEYLATAVFGVATDTLDADGSVLTREPMPVTEAAVAEAFERFHGTIAQLPPMVSARKVDGRRLYELAREGKEVEREARPVQIYELELVDFAPSDYPEVTFRVRCSKGTYVRTLADDVASALGGRAHLSSLRRSANGHFDVGAAVTVEQVAAAVESDAIEKLVASPADGLSHLPTFTVNSELAQAIANGIPLPAAGLGAASDVTGPACVVDPAGDLLAVYGLEAGRATAEVVIP